MKQGLLMRALPLICAATLVAGGCAEDGGRGEAADAPPAPETKEAIIVIEGMAEPLTLHRYESPADAPVAFSTYLPDGIQARTEPPGSEGWTVRFVAAPGSDASSAEAPQATTGGASLEVVFLPAGTTPEEGRARVRDRAESAGSRVDGYPASARWLEKQRFRGVDDGYVSLGQYEDHLFQLTVRYAPEWGDGFLPRASWILEEWVWTESREPLQPLP